MHHSTKEDKETRVDAHASGGTGQGINVKPKTDADGPKYRIITVKSILIC